MKIKITKKFECEELPKLGDILYVDSLENDVYWCVWRGVEIPINVECLEVVK
jgi:hypothetical protein